MSIQLMPSQKACLDNVLSLEKEEYRRNNIILFGRSQTGKSEMAKYLSLKYENYIYKNFTKEYLDVFLSGKRLGSVMVSDFQLFLRKTFSSFQSQNKIIILDEIDSIIPLITESNSGDNLILYKQLLTMDQPLKYIFITSHSEEDIIKKLINIFGNRIVVLDFLKGDKDFVAENYFNNIKLFDYNEITNLRQMFNKKS